MATPAVLPEQPRPESIGARTSTSRLPRRLWLHLLLFVITVGTTTIVGMRYQSNFASGLFPLHSEADVFPFGWIRHNLRHAAWGVPFSATLLSILLTHEFGHYYAAKAFRVRASLPYLLPAPTLSGTAGAVIRLGSRIRSRAALIAIGAFGPICGFAVALLTTFAGALLSVPVQRAPMMLVDFDRPLLLRVVFGVLHAVGVNRSGPLLWHPVLVASWIGLLITALNLVPAGQLDGGHILYALSPRLHRVSTFVSMLALAFLGIFAWSGWLLWVGLLLLPGMRHPAIAEETPLPRIFWLLAPLALVIFVLCWTPAPFAHSDLLDTIHRIRTGGS